MKYLILLLIMVIVSGCGGSGLDSLESESTPTTWDDENWNDTNWG